MKEWMLGHDGFIMEYMIAGPKVTPFKSDERAENQLELEARLRAQIVTPKKEEYQVDPRLGQEAGQDLDLYGSGDLLQRETGRRGKTAGL